MAKITPKFLTVLLFIFLTGSSISIYANAISYFLIPETKTNVSFFKVSPEEVSPIFRNFIESTSPVLQDSNYLDFSTRISNKLNSYSVLNNSKSNFKKKIQLHFSNGLIISKPLYPLEKKSNSGQCDKDIINPTITANDNKVVTTDSGQCGANVIVSATASDNCSVGDPSGVRSDGKALTALFPIGITTIKWNVTDVNNNPAQEVSQTVTVTDNQIPVITANDNKVVTTDSGQCGANVTISASATDNCSIGDPTGVRSDGKALTALFPIGITTIKWNVKDVNNNSAQEVSQTVTVTDDEKPTITAPADKLINSDTDKCTASGVSLGTPSTADNCGVKSVTSDAPSIFLLGNTTVTWTVSDNSNNIQNTTQIITVEDKQVPIKPTLSNIENWSCGNVITNFPVTTDNCSGEITGTTTDPLQYDTFGTYTITWTFTDSSINKNSVSVTQEIIIPEPKVEQILQDGGALKNESQYCNSKEIKAISFTGAGLDSERFEWSYKEKKVINENTTYFNTDIGLSSNGTGNIPQFTAKNNTSEPIIAVFTVIPFGNECQGNPVEFSITINPTPTITKPADIVVCAGEAVEQINFPGASVSGTRRDWKNDNISIGLGENGRGNIDSFTAVNNTSGSIFANITVTPFANDCEGISETFTIEIKPKPIMNQVPGAQLYCNGETTEILTLGSKVAETKFNISGGSAIGLSNRTNITQIPSFTAKTGTATITVTPVTNGCTGYPVTYDVIVNPTPAVSVSPASQQICSSETTSISLSGSAESFSWEITEVGSNISGAAQGIGNSIKQTLNNSGNQPQIVKYKITPEAMGCAGTPITVIVTVNPIPLLEITDPLPVCSPAKVDLTVSEITAGSTSGTTLSYWTDENTTIPISDPKMVGPGRYFIKSRSSSNCSMIQPITVTENQSPELISSLNPPGICSDYPFNYDPQSNVPGTTFAWTREAISGISNSAGAGTGDPDEILFNTTNNTIPVKYVYRLRSLDGCESEFEVNVKVTSTPTLTSDQSPENVCNGNLFEYSPTSNISGTTFNWSRQAKAGNEAGSGSGNISETLVNNTGSPVGIRYDFILSSSGCTNPDAYSVIITVLPTPEIEVSASTHEICPGSSINLFSTTDSNAPSVDQILLEEGFNGNSNNWSVENKEDTNYASKWRLRTHEYEYNNNREIESNDNSQFYLSEGDETNGDNNTSLISPPLNTNGYTSLELTFYHYYRDRGYNDDDYAYVDVSTDGNNWNNLVTYNSNKGDRDDFQKEIIDLTEYISESLLYIRFKYNTEDGNARRWAIDNVKIEGESSSQTGVTWTSSTDEWKSIEANPKNVFPSETTTYTAIYSDPDFDCPGVATVEVIVRQPPNPIITASYCGNSNFIELRTDGNYRNYVWESRGETLEPVGDPWILNAELSGTYTVTVIDEFGCTGTGFIDVSNELIINGSFDEVDFEKPYNYIKIGSENGYDLFEVRDKNGKPVFITQYNLRNDRYHNPTGHSSGALGTEATVAIDKDASFYHSDFDGKDHTTGDGNFLMVNAAPESGKVIWRQTIENIHPNTNYYFSAWGMNLNPASPARLQFYVNGVPTGTIAELNSADKPTSSGQVNRGNWVQFYSNPFWESKLNETAVIEIIDLNTVKGGNDFGLDDISFGTLEQIKFEINPENNSILCQGEELELYANIKGGRFPITFEWTGPPGSDFSHITTVNTREELNIAVKLKIPDITADMAGTYTLKVTDFYGCTPKTGTTEVLVLEINAGEDKTVCSNITELQLNGIISGSDDNGTWSGGSGNFSSSTALDAIYTTHQDDIAAGSIILTLTSNDPDATCADQVVISFLDSPEATIDVTNVSCFGISNGTATVNVTGGTPPYNYSWENGQNEQTATGLLPKAEGYNVIVTDANFCSVEVTSPPVLEPSALAIGGTSVTDVTCFGGTDGIATLDVSGGFITGEHKEYSLTLLDRDGNVVSSEDSNTTGNLSVSGLSAGVYTFTANTVNGCSLISENIIIDQPLEIIVDAGEDIIIFECGITAVHLNATLVDPNLGAGRWEIFSIEPSENNTASFDNASAPDTWFTGQSDTRYELKWIITPTIEVCEDSDIMIVQFEKACNKLNFDGEDDYVDAGDHFAMGGSNFSVEAWVKPNAISGVNTIISKRIAGESNLGYDLFLNNAAPSFRVRNRTVTSTKSIGTDRWYHIAAVYTSSKISLYVDGIEVQNNTNNIPSGSGNFNAPFLIGATHAPSEAKLTTQHFNGFIEEVRIWKKSISKEHIRFFMNQRLVKTDSKVDGEILTKNLNLPNAPILSDFTDLLGYYQLLAQVDLVSSGKTLNLGSTGNSADGLLKNIQFMQENTAPLPYILNTEEGNWFDKSTWTLPTTYHGVTINRIEVWDAPGSKGINDDVIEWNIVGLNGKSVKNTEKNIQLLALLDGGGNLDMEGINQSTGSGLTITHYLKLNGSIDLNGESQLIQTEGSILESTSTGFIERDQQGTASSYNYNYWSSPVVTRGISNNPTYTISDVLFDGTTATPQPISFGDGVTFADRPLASPIRISNRWLYKFHGEANQYSEWAHVGSSKALTVGEGYTMKGTSGELDISDLQNYTFKGKPNNGPISLTVGADQNYLLGNPYPSAIDANKFILDNLKETDVSGATNTANIFNGALYFWDHFSGKTHNLAQYVGGYATRNLLDGVPAVSNDERINANDASGTKIPGQFIPVAQGFFINTVLDPALSDVISVNGGQVIFKNSQRFFVPETDSENSQFLRPERPASKSKEQVKQKIDTRAKIRLDFRSPMGYHRQILAGVDPNTTNGFDLGYDAALNDDNPEDMFWLIHGNEFVIQGVPHFELEQVLPLGIKLKEVGDFSIRINKLENIAEDVNIYLNDLQDSTYFDLRKGDFSMSLEPGNYKERFQIVFQKEKDPEPEPDPDEETEEEEEEEEEQGGSEEDEFTDGNIEVFYLGNTRELLILNPEKFEIQSVIIYDMLGAKIQEYQQVSNNIKEWLPVREFAAAVYVVKLYSGNKEISKSIILIR